MDNLTPALNSFEGFLGAAMQTNPTNQAEFSALELPQDGGGSCWSGTPPTWKQVKDKMDELDAADAQRLAAKDSGKQKLKALGLTDDEVESLISPYVQKNKSLGTRSIYKEN